MSYDVPVGFLQTVLFQTHKGWRFELSLSHLKRFLGVLAYSLIILACVFISHETQQKQGLADSPGFGLNQLELPFNHQVGTTQTKTHSVQHRVETTVQPHKMATHSKKHITHKQSDNLSDASFSNASEKLPVLTGHVVGVIPTGLGQSQL
jgi:hypothetical protein